jgi:hypothetical protein
MLLKYLAERQHFLTNGWAVVRDAFPQATAMRLRELGAAAVRARPDAFPQYPTIASSCREYWLDEAATVEAMVSRRRRILTRLAALKRKRRGLPPKVAPATGSEIMAMTQLLMKRSLVSPAVRDAVDRTRKNIWMTCPAIEKELCGGPLGALAGRVAEEIGGVERPVLAADSPLLQEPFGAPMAFAMAAPLFPVDPRVSAAVSVWAFTHTSSASKSSVHLLRPVERCALQRQLHRLYENGTPLTFPREMETVTNTMTRLFDLPSCGTVSETVSVQEGSVLIVDPYVFVGMGPNYDTCETLALQLLIADRNAELCLTSPSWVQLLSAETVVPDLHAETFFPRLGW